MFTGQRKSRFPALWRMPFHAFPALFIHFTVISARQTHFTIHDAWQGSLTQTLWHPPHLPSICDNLWSTGRPRQLRRCLSPIIQSGLDYLRGEDLNGGVVNPKLMYRDWEYWAQRRARSMMFSVIPTISLICTIKKQKYENFYLPSLWSLLLFPPG